MKTFVRVGSLCLVMSMCASCDNSPEEQAAETKPSDLATTQSALDFGCLAAAGAPNFWVARDYFKGHKRDVPVSPLQGNDVGGACSDYYFIPIDGAVLGFGDPYTVTCACKDVCDDGGCGICNNRPVNPHTWCTNGAPLTAVADYCASVGPGNEEQIIRSVCAAAPSCCSTEWTVDCVSLGLNYSNSAAVVACGGTTGPATEGRKGRSHF